MKKILLAIFSLISVISYSQTTGYLRYDTVRIQRGGGNSTLVIENATRTLTNGFLQNYAEGRTKFAYALDSVWIDGDSIRFRYGTTTLAVLLPIGEVTQSALDDTAAAIRADFPTPSSGGISEVIAGYGLQNVNDSTLDVDSLVIANRDWVMDRIADIDTANLIVDSLGAAGISPITTWNNTIYGRRISISGGSIDTTASGGLLITVSPSAGGITSLNGLTDATQTFAMGTTAQSNNLGWVSASGVHTLHVPDATATVRGVVINGSQTFGGAKFFGTDSYAGTDATGIQVSGSTVLGSGSGSSEVVIANANTTTGTSGLGFRNNSGTQFALLRSFNASFVGTIAGINMASGFAFQSTSGAAPMMLNASGGPIYLAPNTTTPVMSLISAGRVGLNAITAPTAWLHLPTGTTAASTAPLKITQTSAALMTTAEAGAIEVLTDKIYYTINTGAARKEFTLNDAALTSGRIPFVTTNGRLTDVSGLEWNGTTAIFPLIKITGGSPGANKVLTSDADGDATWTTAVKPTLTKNATIENPTASENMGWFRTPVAITVTNTHAVLVGTGTPSVTYQISFGTDITSLTNVYSAGQTVTSTTTGDAASGVNDATIPANSWIRITTSASTTTTQISLSITYTED